MVTVVLERVKYPHNLAAAIRASACFGVSRVLWTGERFAFAEGERLPREERMKGYASVEFCADQRPLDRITGVPVCVELTPSAQPLDQFVHPPDAIYVFGPEDGGVSRALRTRCHSFVYIPSRHCLNLAAALNVVLYDRVVKCGLRWSAAEYERRGIEIPGWDGR